MTDAPDIDEIEQIVQDAQSDAGAVNQRITNAYHRLSETIRAALAAGSSLDWCGFAKWSSHTVGFNLNPQLTGLRTDEITNQIMGHLPDKLEVFRPKIIDLLQSAVDVEDGLVDKALRGGNAMIFREMGSVFVLLLEQFGERARRSAPSDEEVARKIIAAMQSGAPKFLKPPIDRTLFTDADEDDLMRAITFYLRAAREPDHCAELMLAGNMQFSVYEQTRADRLITIGTCAPVRARIVGFLRKLSLLDEQSAQKLLLAGPGGPGPASTPFIKSVVAPFVTQVDKAFGSMLTDRALVVEIAGERVRLGHPEQLTPQVIPTLPEVKAVLDAQASDAPRNWLDLRYRLAFIAKYFAACQQKPGAAEEPQHPGPA